MQALHPSSPNPNRPRPYHRSHPAPSHPPAYVPASYWTPGQAITWVHNLPRANFVQDLALAPNTFPGVDFRGADLTYYEGIASCAGAYVAVAVLGTIGFLVILAVAACCRHKMGKPRTGCCGTVCAPRPWWVLCILIMLACVAGVLSQVSAFRDAVNGAYCWGWGAQTPFFAPSPPFSPPPSPSLSQAGCPPPPVCKTR